MILQQYIYENPEKTLAEIQAYKNFNDVSKNDIVNHDAIFGVTEIMDGIIAQSPESSLKKEARIFKSICGGLLESVNVMDTTTQYAMDALIANSDYPPEAKTYLESKANIVYPFATATQADIDAINAVMNIRKQECIYPGDLDYIPTTSNQGVDIEIVTDIDCAFVVYLLICANTKNPNDIDNYSPVNGDKAITYPVNSNNGKLLIELSSRKVRAYNKLFIKPSAVCTFTASTTANRG
jgi:hypothetical protein